MSVKLTESDTPELAAPETKHIVDVLIEERARHLLHMPVVWPLVQHLGYPLLKYKSAVEMADAIAAMSGREVMDHVSGLLNLHLTITGADHIPREGKFMLVANHPTGIADGIAVYDALKPIRPDMVFFANRDALRVSPGLDDIIIPIEWVVSERSAAKSRETVKRMVRAFRDESVVVMFPSGKLAQPKLSGIREEPWASTVVNLARRNNTPIVPLYMRGRNSLLYYFLCLANRELRDMTLFNELLNKTQYPFQLTFGAPIPPEALGKDGSGTTERLKSFVEFELARNPAATFGA